MEYTYKTTHDGVIRSDGAMIPNSDGNRDWCEYLKWFGEGNVPDPIYSLSDLRQIKVQGIKTAYDNLSLTPIAVSVNDIIFNIDITEKAQADWMKLVILGQLTNSDVSIRDADNQTRTLTYSEFVNVVQQIGQFLQIKWAERCDKIDLARSITTTREQLDAITF